MTPATRLLPQVCPRKHRSFRSPQSRFTNTIGLRRRHPARVTSFVRTDHIGRPVFATNTTGTKIWTASYTPFGGVRTTTGTPINARFPGQWFQSESGLHQNWMRDYDPTTGRYLQADPLGLVDGASVYGYARQAPMMYTDPRGEEVSLQFWSGAGRSGSSLGHVSGQINGRNYSFAPNGMNIQPHSEYLGRNTFRSGVDVTLDLSFPGKEIMLEMCLQRRSAEYGLLENNCTDPWEACLRP